MYRYADRSTAALAKLYLKYFRRIRKDDSDLLELLLLLRSIYNDSYNSLRQALLITASKTYAASRKRILQEAKRLDPNESEELLNEIVRRLQNDAFWKDDVIDYIFIDTLLNRVDPVLKYSIRAEIERRQAKNYEALTVSTDRRKDANNAALELLRISAQALDNATDEANRKAIEDAGVKYVRWNAILDRKTCAECRSLDGRIFMLEEAPEKPHPHCRCYLEPVLRKAVSENDE